LDTPLYTHIVPDLMTFLFHFLDYWSSFWVLLVFLDEFGDSDILYEGVSKSFWTESITKFTLTFGIDRW